MKDIIQELNKYNVPIIKIDDNLANIKYNNYFSQKLADANAFLARAGVPKSFTTFSDDEQLLTTFIDESDNYELSFDRLSELYQAKGYPFEWVQQRVETMKIRRNLIDEWRLRGIKEGQEFSLLTTVISKNAFGLTPSEYSQFKGLNRENLRDNMTPTELYFTALGETYTIEQILKRNAFGFKENHDAAIAGGTLAANDLKQMESKQGVKVISNQNFRHLLNGGSTTDVDRMLN